MAGITGFPPRMSESDCREMPSAAAISTLLRPDGQHNDLAQEGAQMRRAWLCGALFHMAHVRLPAQLDQPATTHYTTAQQFQRHARAGGHPMSPNVGM
jgi:hypothetical protein